MLLPASSTEPFAPAPPLPGGLPEVRVVRATCPASLDRIRSEPETRLVLAIAADEAMEIALLAAGADDVVRGDASPALIAARVAALRRRATTAGWLTVGDLSIDMTRRTVARAGRDLILLPREYAVLVHLARHAGEVVSRSALLAVVWGLAFDPGTNVVAVQVSRLRAELHAGGAAPMLLTERARGYRLVAAD